METSDTQPIETPMALQELIVNAPEYLSFGQDIWDQEPFSLVTSDISKKTGRQDNDFLSYVRAALTVSQDMLEPRKSEVWRRNLDKDTLPTNVTYVRILREKAKSRKIDNDSLFPELIISGVLKLLEYPEIFAYVNTQPQQIAREESYKKSPTPSYAKWYTDKIRKDSNIRTLEAKAAFEKDSTFRIRSSGHRSGWRNWSIKKASNLVVEKR